MKYITIFIVGMLFGIFVKKQANSYNKKKQLQIIEKEVIVMDNEIMNWISQLELIFKNRLSIDELKKINHLKINKQDNKWILYQKVCYYGGCNFDEIEFEHEYDAYKYSAMLDLFRKINQRDLKIHGSETMIADINYNCKNYHECSGRDD